MASFTPDHGFSITCEGITIPSLEGVFPHMKRKMAERFYRDRGYSVIEGDDFEHNMLKLFAKSEPWRAIDKYSKVKMGRNPGSIAADYCREMLDIFSKEGVSRLLYACRFCSYLGGPGFPELIARKPGNTIFIYVGSEDEILASQKMFTVLCRLFEISADFALFDVSEKPIPAKVSFTLNQIIQPLLSGQKVRGQLETLETALREAEKQGLGNHALYWKNEKAKLPFPLFSSWAARAKADSADIEKAMDEISVSGSEMMALFSRMRGFAETSEEFISLGDKHDEATMRSKTAFLVEHLKVNEHTAKDFLTFLMFG